MHNEEMGQWGDMQRERFASKEILRNFKGTQCILRKMGALEGNAAISGERWAEMGKANLKTSCALFNEAPPAILQETSKRFVSNGLPVSLLVILLCETGGEGTTMDFSLKRVTCSWAFLVHF